MTGDRENIAATELQAGDRLHVIYTHGRGYQLGLPADRTMAVTATSQAGASVTITFADGDHWGELVLDAAEPVWIQHRRGIERTDPPTAADD